MSTTVSPRTALNNERVEYGRRIDVLRSELQRGWDDLATGRYTVLETEQDISEHIAHLGSIARDRVDLSKRAAT